MPGAKAARTLLGDRPLVPLQLAVGGLLIIGVLTRFFGLAREILVAALFGASAQLDAVFLGLAIPIALCLGLGGGLSRAIVPLGASISQRQLGGTMRIVGARALSVTLTISLIMAVGAPAWSMILLIGADGTPRLTVMAAAVIGSLALAGGAFAGLAVGLANAQGRHFSASMTPVAYNVCMIVTILVLARPLGPLSVAAGIVAAEWGQVLALTPFLYRIRRYVAPPPRALLEKARRLFWPAVFISMAGGLMMTVDRAFAASLPARSVSALAYSERLLNFPVLLIGLALQQPLYTRLARFATSNWTRSFEETLAIGVRVLLLVGTPAALAVGFLAGPLIGLLLERGAFSGADTELSALAMRGYAPGIVFLAMIPLLLSAGLARGNPWRPAVVLLFAIGLNALLNSILIRYLGLPGIALASSIVALVSCVLLLLLLAPRVLLSRDLWRTVGIALLMACGGGLGLGVYTMLMPALPGMAGQALVLLLGGIVLAVCIALVAGGFAGAEYFRLRARSRTIAARARRRSAS